MSEATEKTTDSSDQKPSKKKPRKKGQRRQIFIMVPLDIDDLEATDAVEELANGSDDDDNDDEETSNGKKKPKPKVKALAFQSHYQMYAVPGGHGQKAAIRKILKKHNVDLRNIHRIRMFAGEKKFEVETQYNIRF